MPNPLWDLAPTCAPLGQQAVLGHKVRDADYKCPEFVCTDGPKERWTNRDIQWREWQVCYDREIVTIQRHLEKKCCEKRLSCNTKPFIKLTGLCALSLLGGSVYRTFCVPFCTLVPVGFPDNRYWIYTLRYSQMNQDDISSRRAVERAVKKNRSLDLANEILRIVEGEVDF